MTRETDNESAPMKIQALMMILSMGRMASAASVVAMGKAAKETKAATRAREYTPFLSLIVAVVMPLCPYLTTEVQGWAWQDLVWTR